MENNQKPEWFELADNDQPTSRPLKKKSAPIRSLTYILAGALVIPMGAGFALLTHEDQSATAVETLNFTQDSPAAISPTQALPENTIAMPVASREDDDEEEGDDDYRAPVFSSTASTAPVSVAPITAPAIQNSLAAAKKVTATKAPVAITPPGSASNEIILPPTKKAGDDDEEEDDDDHNNKKSKKSKDSDDDEDKDDD